MAEAVKWAVVPHLFFNLMQGGVAQVESSCKDEETDKPLPKKEGKEKEGRGRVGGREGRGQEEQGPSLHTPTSQ